MKVSLSALENRLADLGYRVEYRKGAFRSNACMLRDQKLIVVNAFLTKDARVGVLAELHEQLSAPASDQIR